ncbi:LysR family transcriptional regulator [Pararhodobacter marinus]|uniref:LysR family transcriptional regulator n=1 Tax=Pararhodobacter marinus TaxID=2184063 RepID=UPI0035120344
MDLATLSVFRAVARERSVTRAAALLGRAPSNVTTRIQQLETELGTALFHRHRNRLTLSDKGRLFLEYAERILALEDEARQRLDPATPRGTLRIGSMESTLASRLGAPLARFARDWPNVTLDLTSGASRPLIDAVTEGRIDAALVAFTPGEDPNEAGDLEAIPIYRETLLLMLPPDHPDMRDPDLLRPRTLAAFAPGCTYRALAEDWLATEGGPPVRVHEVPSYHAMFACTAAGACLSVMPESVVALMPDRAALRTRPLMSVDTCLINRRGFDTAAFSAFRERLLEGADLTADRP